MDYKSGKPIYGLSVNFPVRVWLLIWLVLIIYLILLHKFGCQAPYVPEKKKPATELYKDKETGEWLERPITNKR